MFDADEFPVHRSGVAANMTALGTTAVSTIAPITTRPTIAAPRTIPRRMSTPRGVDGTSSEPDDDFLINR
jgi:hypothetical protein